MSMGRNKNSSTVGIDTLSLGEIVGWLALAIHCYLAPSLRKKYSYIFTLFVGSYFLFYLEPYL
jgi:hypothetical protein